MFNGFAVTVSAVSSIITPVSAPRSGCLAKQAHHLKTIHSSLQPPPPHSHPHSAATMATADDRQTTRAGALWAAVNLEASERKRMIIMSVWGVGTWRGSHWGEWEREGEPVTGLVDATVWAISHIFGYAGLMIHQHKKKVRASTVLDVEAGGFVLSRQNHESSGLSTPAPRRK